MRSGMRKRVKDRQDFWPEQLKEGENYILEHEENRFAETRREIAEAQL